MEGVACKRSKGLVDIRCDTWRSVRAPTGGGQLGVGCSAAVRVATPPCWRRHEVGEGHQGAVLLSRRTNVLAVAE